jgi:hypothetical protein
LGERLVLVVVLRLRGQAPPELELVPVWLESQLEESMHMFSS